MRIASIEIQDDLAISTHAAIEVVINFDDGRRNWCYFFTPQGASTAGDWLPGTEVRVHFGNPHMILISEISSELIEKTLRHIESKNLLESCTKPCNE
jgi:hypothetical protein